MELNIYDSPSNGESPRKVSEEMIRDIGYFVVPPKYILDLVKDDPRVHRSQYDISDEVFNKLLGNQK